MEENFSFSPNLQDFFSLSKSLFNLFAGNLKRGVSGVPFGIENSNSLEFFDILSFKHTEIPRLKMSKEHSQEKSFGNPETHFVERWLSPKVGIWCCESVPL